MGWAAAVVSILTGLLTILSYLEGCWRYFPPELTMKLMDPDTGTFLEVPASSFPDTIGIGVIFLLVAVCLKFVDFIAHCTLRTPAKKQQHADPSIPFVDYCYLNNKPTRWGQEVSKAADAHIGKPRAAGPNSPKHPNFGRD